MTTNFNKTSAIVTGAASGIGLACANSLLDQGATVLAVDVNKAALERAFAKQGNAYYFTQDISHANAATHICEQLKHNLSTLDIVIHAAGICPVASIEEMSLTQLREIMSVNLESVFSISQALIPFLKQSSRARIITIGSVMSEFSGAGMSAYTTSKHAVLGLTKSLATELGEFGITANCIQPGAILTNITQQAYDDDPAFREYWQNRAALKRWGQPHDIANLACFLASEQASFISGHGIYCDGGAMQQA